MKHNRFTHNDVTLNNKNEGNRQSDGKNSSAPNSAWMNLNPIFTMAVITKQFNTHLISVLFGSAHMCV